MTLLQDEAEPRRSEVLSKGGIPLVDGMGVCDADGFEEFTMSDSDSVDFALLADFRYALRRFTRFSEDAARSSGLTPQQHQALLAVRGFGGSTGITVGQLAERLCSKPQSTSELVTRLEKQGWVGRTHSSDDGRQVRIQLTASGEEILADLSHAHRDELRRMSPELARLLERLGS